MVLCWILQYYLELIISIILDPAPQRFIQLAFCIDCPILRNCSDILLHYGGMMCLMKLLCPPVFLLQCIILWYAMMCNFFCLVYLYCVQIVSVSMCLCCTYCFRICTCVFIVVACLCCVCSCIEEERLCRIFKLKQKSNCDRACENRACGHKLHPITLQVISQY